MFSEIERLLRVKIVSQKNLLHLHYREQQSECLFDDNTASDLSWVACQIAFAFKLAVDRSLDPYDVAQERKQTTKARNIYEITSTYGSRIPMLISKVALDFFDLQSGKRALRTPCHGNQDYYFVYREELRRGIHILCEEDLEEMDFDKNNIVSAANYALFYDRPKPQKREGVHLYVSSDFRVTGILALFPDMIYDLAASCAYVYSCSPNEVKVLTKTSLDDAKEHLAQDLKTSSLPWCTLLFECEAGELKIRPLA